MADILERISNPLWRSTQAALMGASATAILVGGALGLSQLDDQTVSRLAVYSALLGTGAGAVFGLVGVKPGINPGTATQASPSQGWQDWRSFVVERKVPESNEITSFYLKPQDNGALPAFLPGQFLTIKLPIPGQPRPVIRTYSLSDYAASPTHYRLSIKREGPPKGQPQGQPQGQNVPPGLASTFMHDQIQVGSVIEAKPPNGKFVLEVASPRPAVLISNGVGITPMVSMAKAVSQKHPDRSLWFLHGARDGRYHAFREELGVVAAQSPNLTVHYRYSRPRPEDADHHHSAGYVDDKLVQTLLPMAPAEADYFLCGSPPFMESLRAGLMGLGVPTAQIQFESFAKPVPTQRTTDAAQVASPETPSTEATSTAEVVFAKSGKTVTWREDDGTLLEFAEAQGIEAPYSCRAGICLTCMCRLQSGEVAYDESPSGTPDAGSVLICVSKPQSAQVVLDL